MKKAHDYILYPVFGLAAVVAISKEVMDLYKIPSSVAERWEEAKKEGREVRIMLEHVKGTNKWMMKAWKVRPK